MRARLRLHERDEQDQARRRAYDIIRFTPSKGRELGPAAKRPFPSRSTPGDHQAVGLLAAACAKIIDQAQLGEPHGSRQRRLQAVLQRQNLRADLRG
jgi:hypothetical protein